MKTLLFAVLICVLLSSTQGAQAYLPYGQDQGGGGLFTDTNLKGSLDAGKNDPTIIRTRYVTINFDLINAYDSTDVDGAFTQTIFLNLFDNVSFRAVVDSVQSSSANNFTWIGHLEGVKLSQVVLVVDKASNLMAGNISMPNGFYQVRYAGNGVSAIYQIDQSRFPPDDAPGKNLKNPAPSTRGVQDTTASPDDGSIIDVMVVYTSAARAGAGGTDAAMNAVVNLAVAETNQSYLNSGVTQRLRLVYGGEIAYDETGFDWDTTLSRLQNPSDGYMDSVHTLRNTYAADEVVLIAETDGSYCGLAYLMDTVGAAFENQAFALVARTCATGYYSFGHELGHNMGATHDWFVDSSTNSPYTYNKGYVYKGAGTWWRTVMAYGNDCGGCTRLQYWSNPDINYNNGSTNSPMGVAEGAFHPADNRKVLNNTAYTVANFRASGVTPPVIAPPVVTASDGTDTSGVVLSWTASTGATSYLVFRADSLTGSKIPPSGYPVSGLGGTDILATPGVTYYYWVKACNASACSDFSAPETGSRGVAAGLTAPVVTASDGTDMSAVNVSWTASSGATYYLAYRSDSLAGAKIPPNGVSLPGLGGADTLAIPGVTYYYWVKACNASGCSDFSAPETGSRGVAAGLTAPAVTASDGTDTTAVNVSWTASSGATYYLVYRSDSLAGTKIPPSGISTPGLGGADTVAVPGVTYYYWVKACNASTCSDFSSPETGWRAGGTGLLPPQNLR